MTSDVTVPESAVEAASYAIALAHYAKRFGAPASDNHVVSNARASWSIFAADAKIALLAALPHLSATIRDAAPDTVAVPKVAIDWLMGSGPDPAGFWFGAFPEDRPKPRGAFWWRTTFKEICAYASSNALKSIPAPAEGKEPRDRGKMVKPKPGAPAGGYGGAEGNEAESALGPERYHLLDTSPFEVSTAEGTKRLGAGWLIISEEEYRSRQAPAQAPGELVSLGIAWLRGELGEVDPKRLLLAADAIAALFSPAQAAGERK